MDPRIDLLNKHIRDVPDFPKPGIIFKDITPLLASPEAFRTSVELLAEHYRPLNLQGIVAVESRGFIFGGPLALELSVPLHIVRKPGKLPYKTESIEYSLEYGTDKLEIHQDAIQPGHRVLVLDDLLATGGTAAATAQLVQNQGGEVVECGFVIELGFLNGSQKFAPIPGFALLKY
jgi:adenine phosphoribosyltransferase